MHIALNFHDAYTVSPSGIHLVIRNHTIFSAKEFILLQQKIINLTVINISKNDFS